MANVWAIVFLLLGFCFTVAALFGPSIVAAKSTDHPTVKRAILIINLAGLSFFLFIGVLQLSWLGFFGLACLIVSWLLVVWKIIGFLRFFRIFLYLLIILITVRTLVFQPFHIPSEGNKPTLLAGDLVIVPKYSYGYSHFSIPLSPPFFSARILSAEPKRGDVVVFRPPKDSSTDYILRLVGLPGDRIQVTRGALHINAEPVKRERIEDLVETDKTGRATTAKRWRETLPNGVSYETLDFVDNGIADNTQVYIVPPLHYFLMGDNRDNITDSRFPAIGFVPFENLIGPAQIIAFSVHEGERAWQFWRWPMSVRWSRLLYAVR